MKTGIIYCPRHAGLNSIKKRWQRIANALEQYGVEYDLVKSDSAQSVKHIVCKLIHEGYDTIIICGGDKALNCATNCLMREEKEIREKITLGVIPNGLMNDFAKFWGFLPDKVEEAVESIKERRVRKIDVGCVTFLNREGKKQNEYFLNCINIGLVASIQTLKKRIRKIFWSRKLSFIISVFLFVFAKKYWKLEYTINYEKEQHKVMSMCVSSALGFGQTPNAVPYNGLLDTSVILHSPFTRLTRGAALFFLGKILNYKSIRPYRSHDVVLLCPKNTPVSIDGHELPDVDATKEEMRISIEKETINFIIEKC